jgi:hypothetical protein
METASNAAEIFVVRLDPARALERAVDDFERLSKLDPKLGAAMKMLQERFALLPAESFETLGAALWMYSRTRTKPNGFRAWLDNGDLVLRTIEDALGGVFSLPVLKEVIHYGTEIAATDASSTTTTTTEFQQARLEIRRFLSTDILAPVAVLAGAGAAALYLIYVEGYTLQAPSPPPPPPPPSTGKELMHP